MVFGVGSRVRLADIAFMRFALLAFLLLPAAGWSDEPEKLPPPRSAEELLPDWIVILPAEPRPEHGRRSVWQLYDVDATGRFRPRVINSPGGAYYLHSHHPYPWRTLESRYYRPFVSP